jgi:hypothetical protein
MESVAVDDTGRDHADGDAGRAARDRPKEDLSGLWSDLLGIVEQPERPHAVVTQALVVEEDRGRDEGACEASTSCLVGARDEADAEPTVECEELAAGAAYHAPHNSPYVRCFSRTRAFFPTLERR